MQNEQGRRRHPRFASAEIVVIAQFSTAQELFRVPCRDISMGGIFLQTRHRAAAGQAVSLLLRLPIEDGIRSVEVVAEVVRNAPDGSGVALRFTWMEGDESAQGALQACLDTFEAV